jgi:hypothetical protein
MKLIAFGAESPRRRMSRRNAIAAAGLEVETLALHAQGLVPEQIAWRIHARHGVFLKPPQVSRFLHKARKDPRVERAIEIARHRPQAAALSIVGTEADIVGKFQQLEGLMNRLEVQFRTAPLASREGHDALRSLVAASKEARGWFAELQGLREKLPATPAVEPLTIQEMVRDLSANLCDGCKARIAGLT